MSLAKQNAESTASYFKHINFLDERILKAKAMILANQLIKHYLNRRYTHQSINKDDFPEWKLVENDIAEESISLFKRYLYEELEYLGYKAEIIEPKGFSKKIELSVIEELP